MPPEPTSTDIVMRNTAEAEQLSCSSHSTPERLLKPPASDVASVSTAFFEQASNLTFDVQRLNQIAGNSYTFNINQLQQENTVSPVPLNSAFSPNFEYPTPVSVSFSAGTESDIETTYGPRPGNIIYHDHLLAKKRGSPLWIPEPNRRLSMAYRRKGVSIGDVGIFTTGGAFSFMFNICLPGGDPVNPPSLPEGFAPISTPLGIYDMDEFMAFSSDSYLSSTSIEKVYGDLPSQGLTFQTSTQTSAAEGAILTLPEGARSYDLCNFTEFQIYLEANLESWYRYIQGVRGIPVENGKVHLVTGCDKTTTCGMATVSNISKHRVHYLKFCPTRHNITSSSTLSQVGPTPLYRWECSGLAEFRVDPDPTATAELQRNDDLATSIAVGGNYWNQCIFLRTMNATLKEEIFDAIKMEAAAKKVEGVRQLKLRNNRDNAFLENGLKTESSETQVDTPARSSGTTLNGMANTTKSVSMFPATSKFHPAYNLNKRLLQRAGPKTRMAITRDVNWYSVLGEDENVMPSSEELERRVFTTHHIRERNGVAYLEPTEEHLKKTRTRPSTITVTEGTQHINMKIQHPTLQNVRIRSTREALQVFHAVATHRLPLITRRLDAEERRNIAPGNVYVWQECGANMEQTDLGVERWTDGIRWGPSRVRDEFMFYHQKGSDVDDDLVNPITPWAQMMRRPGGRPNTRPFSMDMRSVPETERLIKQTYSVHVSLPTDKSRGVLRKWHLTAYSSPSKLDELDTIDNLRGVGDVVVPEGWFRSARIGKSKHDSRTHDSLQTEAPGQPSTSMALNLGSHQRHPSSSHISVSPTPSDYSSPVSSSPPRA